MRKILFILFALGSFTAMSQSGYFGSRSSVDLTIGVGPSFNRTSHLVESATGDIYSRRLRIANLNYRLGYSFVAAKKVEVGIAYEYARMRSYSQDVRVRTSGSDLTYNLFEDIMMSKHGIRLKTLIFIKGSNAPLGKYFGFSTGIGTAKVLNDSISFGQRGSFAAGTGFITRKSEIVSQFKDDVAFSPARGYYLNFRGTIGHNYPLNKKMLLKVSFDFPILSVISGPADTKVGAFYVFNPLSDDIDDVLEGESVRISNGNVGELMSYTIHKYNRIQFEVGLKYQL